MNITSYEIIPESVKLDDYALVQRFCRLREAIKSKEDVFFIRQKKNDEDDYLSVAVARLAYIFAKEEYEALYEEIEKRGLITT